MKTLSRSRTIEHWDAEDVDAWEGTGGNAPGKGIAKRNLIWSIFAEHVGFSVWSIWSVMVLFMPQNVYHIDAAGKFYLVAVPTLVGAAMRIPYTDRPGKVRRAQLDDRQRTAVAHPDAADALGDETPGHHPTPRSWSSRPSPVSVAATSRRR